MSNTMKPEYVYSATADDEAWDCEDDFHLIADRILHGGVPGKNLRLSIYRGEKTPIPWEKLVPELNDFIQDSVYDLIGDRTELALPENLQERFFGWLEGVCGETGVFSIENIKTVDIIFRDDSWHLTDDSMELKQMPQTTFDAMLPTAPAMDAHVVGMPPTDVYVLFWDCSDWMQAEAIVLDTEEPFWKTPDHRCYSIKRYPIWHKMPEDYLSENEYAAGAPFP